MKTPLLGLRKSGASSGLYRTFHKPGEYELWQKLNRDLSFEYRLQQGREPQQSAGVIDSQTAKSTPTSSSHGYDAGKKTKGTKRHILVDSLGLLLGVVVHCASIVDCRGAALVFERAAATGAVGERFEHIWADGGYDRITTYGNATQHGWRLEVLLRPEGAKSFVVIQRRWVVERTFAWLTANRRLARDYERKAASSETFIYMAMCRTLLARLTKY